MAKNTNMNNEMNKNWSDPSNVWQNNDSSKNSVWANQANQTNQTNGQAAWTDQDMIGDLLSQEKTIIGAYSTYVCEGANQPVRQMFTSHLQQTFDDQFQLFQSMQQRGWYQTQPAQQQDFKQAVDKANQHKNQMAW
ncbi:hypothetical protein FACS18948_7230 [Clostridia bacterium]|nr:hypothetical protein FACS18948_7230 [Clostridia bacterium]